jgi:hypothetical protein
MAEDKTGVRLTKTTLQQLKDKGFHYVLIKGYSVHKKVDYIELDTFRLIPVKELPQDPAQKEIYASLDSDILLEWTSAGTGSIEAFIDGI